MQQENNQHIKSHDALSFVTAFLENPSYGSYKNLASNALPADIAEALKSLTEEECRRFLTLLPSEFTADIVQELDIDLQVELFGVLGAEKTADIVSEMESDDAADVLSELDESQAKEILEGMDEEGEDVKDLLKYEEDTSGGIMATEYVALNKEWDVNRAFEELRAICPDADKAYYVYVVDDYGRLVGVLSLRDLVMAERTDRIAHIMNENVMSIKANSDQEEAAHTFKKYGFLSLPVIDEENRLTGIISANDIIDVIDEETTEDIQKMSASSPLEGTYMSSKVFELWSKRVVWLLALFITGALTSGIMRSNEALLSQFVTLIFFVPLLIDEGGNAGSQASATIIRALALREFQLGDYISVLWKEFKVSLMLGLSLAAMAFAAAAIMPSEHMLWTQAGYIVGLSTLTVVFFGSALGSILPIAAHLVGLDPAVLAGPVITTIVDSAGLLIYFGIAKAILRI